MAALAAHLADTRAVARLRNPSVVAELAPLIEARLAAACRVADLELAGSTRTGNALDELRAVTGPHFDLGIIRPSSRN